MTPLLQNQNNLETYTLRNKFDSDYTSLPVGKARQRKIDFLRRLKKGGVNKEVLIQRGVFMNMYGSDISTAINGD